MDLVMVDNLVIIQISQKFEVSLKGQYVFDLIGLQVDVNKIGLY